MERLWQPISDDELGNDEADIARFPVVTKGAHQNVFILRFLDYDELAKVLDEVIYRTDRSITSIIIIEEPGKANWLIRNRIPGKAIICLGRHRAS